MLYNVLIHTLAFTSTYNEDRDSDDLTSSYLCKCNIPVYLFEKERRGANLRLKTTCTVQYTYRYTENIKIKELLSSYKNKLKVFAIVGDNNNEIFGICL